MAEMVCSALVQEAVSRAISSVLGKREEKASQGHIMERLEMAVSNLELALERSAKLPITDVSLLRRGKMIRCAYAKATELLDRHKHSVIGTKRKRWIIPVNGLKTEDVRRLEWSADCAGKFLSDVETGCSFRHHTFCNPLVRLLLEGKTLEYITEQGNQLRDFYIWPLCSEERGVEAILNYRYEDATVAEKSFCMHLVIRLAESTDIVGMAIKCLQLLTSQFKLELESAIGELSLVANSQDVSHKDGLPWVGVEEFHIEDSQLNRPDPICCRPGHCAHNSVSSELSHIFPEQVIYVSFLCYISALEYNLCSSSDEAGRSVSRGWSSPLEVRVGIMPHEVSGNEEHDCYALEILGNDDEVRDVSIQQVAETVRSSAINSFLCQAELTEYRMYWYSKHGGGYFIVKKKSSERAGASTTSRSYNTQESQDQLQGQQLQASLVQDKAVGEM